MDWQKIKSHDFHPTYTDMPLPPIRGYGNPGRYVCDEKGVRLEPEPRQLKFIIVFGWIFLPAFFLLGCFFVPPPMNWAVMIAGPLLGGFTLALFYFLIKHEIDAGPHITFDNAADEILLPRFNKSFQRKAVTLQWITGRSEHDTDIQTDLNLIVEENGNLNRYFLIGGPFRKHVKNFVKEANIPVIEINTCLLYTSPSPRDKRQSRMPSSA